MTFKNKKEKEEEDRCQYCCHDNYEAKLESVRPYKYFVSVPPNLSVYVISLLFLMPTSHHHNYVLFVFFIFLDFPFIIIAELWFMILVWSSCFLFIYLHSTKNHALVLNSPNIFWSIQGKRSSMQNKSRGFVWSNLFRSNYSWKCEIKYVLYFSSLLLRHNYAFVPYLHQYSSNF